MQTQTKPKRLMARVACHQGAIAIARQAGFTWKEIGARLGASGAATRKAFARAQAAMEAGRLVPMEQAPLPDPPPPPPAATVKPSLPVVSQAGESQQERRPTRPGWTHIPIDK